MRPKQGVLAILVVLANLGVWALVLPGCATISPQRDALRAAEISFTTYESVSNAVVEETKRLLNVSYARSLTDEERLEITALNDLRGVLDRYSEAHNVYVRALRLGQGIDQARQQVVTMWRQVRDEAVNLRLHFNAVAP